MKNILTLIALLVLGFSLWSGKLAMHGLMMVAFLSFLALLFFANLDRISEFKAGKSGFEAKTREVTKVVEEAKSTIKELQLLSKIVAMAALSLVKRTGRIGGYSDEEEETIKESILKVLHQLGIPDEERKELLHEWHKFVRFDYAHYILGGPTILSNLTPEQRAQEEKLRHGGLDNIPSPEELTQFLGECGLLSPEVKELIDDYRYYIKCQEHRRPEVWKNRKKWLHLHPKA
jgi:hypothetical protein